MTREIDEREVERGGAFPVLKGAFPFRLATTSFILPNAILPNVRFLGPYLDEVELVLFESGQEENLPTVEEIGEVRRVARELDLTYNVHLPTDLFLGDPDPRVRERACRTVLRFYGRTLGLDPTVYILHLDPRSPNGREDPDEEGWLDRTRRSLQALLGEGMDAGRLAVENLSYPLERIRPLVEEMGMGYCLDVGHLLRYGFPVRHHFRTFLGRTSMIHLHGVQDAVDHRGLEWISPRDWDTIREALAGYRGGVSLEVFSVEDLSTSLSRMAELRDSAIAWP